MLELEPGVPLASVKRAYRELVKVWHPDRFAPGSHSQGIAQEKLKEINDAYERLCKKRVPEFISGLGEKGGKAAETAESSESSRPHWQEDFEAGFEDDGDSAGTGAKAEKADSDGRGDRRAKTAGMQGATRAKAREARPAVASHEHVSAGRLWGFSAILFVAFVALWFLSSKPQAPAAKHGGAGLFHGSLAQWTPQFLGGAAASAAPASDRAAAGAADGAARGKGTALAIGKIGASPLQNGAQGSILAERAPAPLPDGRAAAETAQAAGTGSEEPAAVSPGSSLHGSDANGFCFTIGSTRDEVVAIQGKPDAFTATTLQYGSSIVVFKDDRVESWLDGNPRLKARLPLDRLSARIGYFTVGSRKDEVIAIQGQPDSYTPTAFHYGLSTVFFRDDRVEYWRDVDSKLRARVFPRLFGPIGGIQPVIVSRMPSRTPATATALAAPDLSPNSTMPPPNATSVLPRRSPDTSETSAPGSRNAPK